MGHIIKRKTCRLGLWRWSDRERQREREEWMQWTGSIRNEFPEMAMHGWAELAWIREVETGWGVESLLHVQLDRKTTERKRERGPRALTGVALYSIWGLTADLDLWIFFSMSMSMSLSPSVKTHALTLRVTHTTSRMLHHVHNSSFNMASLPTSLQHSHSSSQSCPELKTITFCPTGEQSPSIPHLNEDNYHNLTEAGWKRIQNYQLTIKKQFKAILFLLTCPAVISINNV